MTTRETRPRKPVPVPEPLTEPFWEGTRAGELRVQRCKACGANIFYPRERCPKCFATDLEWVKTSGRGRVYTYTVVRQPGNPAFNDDVPYIFAIIQLDEGPRMNSNVTGIPFEQVKVDMPVEVYFEQVSEDIWLPKFRPVSP